MANNKPLNPPQNPSEARKREIAAERVKKQQERGSKNFLGNKDKHNGSSISQSGQPKRG